LSKNQPNSTHFVFRKIMTSVSTRELCAWLDTTLRVASFKDYCPNGLQVEGLERVSHIIAGVTASQALIDIAIARGADALLVHHGWFWRGDDPRIRGTQRTRLASLLAANINLLAYHLPLDAHPTLGNNAQLASRLGLVVARQEQMGGDSVGAPRTAGASNLIWLGAMPGAATLGEVAAQVASRLGREPLVVGAPEQPVGTIAWCTGAAQGMFSEAIDAGADLFITGEVSEPTVHLARESGVGFIGAGHHATERYGVQALAQAIQQQFGVKVDFIDIDNPV
jgi:dinuclear metal center YbgI/SA1388 family protein